jgi:tetratricopeptide (TPR) repeat protein
VEILADANAPASRVLEQTARAQVDWHRRAMKAHPDGATECNNLAWALLTAPEQLREPARALALAQKAVQLDRANSAFRNTLGLAYYRAGRYREAVEILRASLEEQDDRYLSWDLCFLAMSYHQLGEADRAREYRELALRWSRDQKDLSVGLLHELSAIREEMEAVLAK